MSGYDRRYFNGGVLVWRENGDPGRVGRPTVGEPYAWPTVHILLVENRRRIHNKDYLTK